MASNNPKNQLALDLGDTAAKLTVRDLVVRGEIETPKPRTRKTKPAPTFERALVDGADCALRRRCGSRSELLVLLATYLGSGRSYAACELFGGSRNVHDADAHLGRDRTRMLVADVLELGASVESGHMGDVTSAMAHLVGTLAGLGVELDRSRLCRHAMRLLAQSPRRYRSRASSIMSWASCVERQMHVRGRVTDPFPEDPRALEERLEMERVERRDGAQDARIRARAEALAGKSYSDGAFSIRPVASASEMVEEAESQHNCLATYVEAVAEGMTEIWLMRRANDPDRSHVTVEVRDGEVRQAFRACNQLPSDSELRWLAAMRAGWLPPAQGAHAGAVRIRA